MKAGYAPSAKKHQGNRANGDTLGKRLSEARTVARLITRSAPGEWKGRRLAAG
jgi:hypothetical protein